MVFLVMWTNTHCLNFFSCNLIYIVSICAKLQTSSASPSILINLFKVATPWYISNKNLCQMIVYHVAKIINHTNNVAEY